MIEFHHVSKWFIPGLGVKRWIGILAVGITGVVMGLLFIVSRLPANVFMDAFMNDMSWIIALVLFFGGVLLTTISMRGLSRNLLDTSIAPGTTLVDSMLSRSQKMRGPNVVAIGGGTGLPSVLRGLKTRTSNITAVVTVADDGGSSGRLRREMGVLPPGDLRNNIAALADDENLMTKLFQFRFETGDLGGHSFGNLFITALASVTDGGLETALAETARVLNITGRVLPSTMQNVNLHAKVRLKGESEPVEIYGESAIGHAGGQILSIALDPPDAPGYSESVQAILNAELIVMGPGSLYTSIIPNLIVPDIGDALRATTAYKVYVCNVATQPGETSGYTVAEHVMAIEDSVGRGVFQAVLANNFYPPPPPDSKTKYVPKAPANHHVLQRYEVFYTDLTDDERPWRHDPEKLANSLLTLYREERSGGTSRSTLFAEM